MSAAAGHCHELSRQRRSPPTTFRVRARTQARPRAWISIGTVASVRGSALQPFPSAPVAAVARDVGTGGVRGGRLGGGPPPRPPRSGAPSGSLTAGPLPRGWPGGVGTSRRFGRTDARGNSPQSRQSLFRASGSRGIPTPCARVAPWAVVARRAANGRGRSASPQPECSADSTGVQLLQSRVRRGMNGIAVAARSEA